MSERLKRGTLTRPQKGSSGGRSLSGAAVNLYEESQVINIRLPPLCPSLGDASHCLNPTGSQGAKRLLVQPCCQFPRTQVLVRGWIWKGRDSINHSIVLEFGETQQSGVGAPWLLSESTCSYPSSSQGRHSGTWGCLPYPECTPHPHPHQDAILIKASVTQSHRDSPCCKVGSGGGCFGEQQDLVAPW